MPAYRYRVLVPAFMHDPDAKVDSCRLYKPGEILVSKTELEIGMTLPEDHIGACDASLLVPSLELLED